MSTFTPQQQGVLMTISNCLQLFAKHYTMDVGLQLSNRIKAVTNVLVEKGVCTEEDIEQARADLSDLSHAMLHTAIGYSDLNEQPPRNRRFDAGFYGTGINPYLPVILGETTLDDDSRYMDRLNPYDTITEEEEDVD